MTTDLSIRAPLLLVLALGGCMNATGAFTKDEGRALLGRSEMGEDICALMGWYGDGACDDFCLEPDPDCECAALIACEEGETPHRDRSECPADASCREISNCGTTIWCSGGIDECAAQFSCEPGETAHTSESDCPADASCRAVTHCGETFWCASYEAPRCAGENPAGCTQTGCEPGFHCDTTAGDRPSACSCSPESGSWTCTADLNGGECVPD